jgi:hypothetical protein
MTSSITKNQDSNGSHVSVMQKVLLLSVHVDVHVDDTPNNSANVRECFLLFLDEGI